MMAMSIEPFPVHSAAAVFPPPSDEDVGKLAESVRTHGLRNPIVTTIEHGQTCILDGRRRFRACLASGVEPRFVTYEGDDPIALVVSANLHRRRLTAGQRALVADHVVQVLRNPDPTRLDECIARTAHLFDISARALLRVRCVLEKGLPETVTALESGAITLAAASDLTTRPADEQRRRLAEGPTSVLAWSNARRAPKKLRSPSPVSLARKGVTAKEIRSGVLRVRSPGLPAGVLDLDAMSVSEKRKLVVEMRSKGIRTSDISERTGLSKRFVWDSLRDHNARGASSRILQGAIQDAEVFAESWSRRVDEENPRWLQASAEERAQLLEALRACRSAAQRMIFRIVREGKQEQEQ